MAAVNGGDLIERVARALAEQVGPALAMDGAAIEVLDVCDGVARVRLGSVCGGCPATLMMVIMGIEQELRKHVPEVEYLEAAP
jgi:Fe-S cluster biogenesis protein NfuA